MSKSAVKVPTNDAETFINLSVTHWVDSVGDLLRIQSFKKIFEV